MHASFQTKRTTLTFLSQNLPKNRFTIGNSENLCQNNNQHPLDSMCANFQAKQTTLTFFDPNLPKNRFRIGNSEN